MGNNKPSSLKFALFWGTVAFFTAIFFSFFSEIVLPRLQILMLSFSFLLLVIITGIVFDMVGVSVAVANEHPFHAKATKRLRGATQAIVMVRHADKVATFCNDVIGDICGTVSGALGASIVFQIIAASSTWSKYESIASMLMTGVIAAVTVGGKATGKRAALNDWEEIVFFVGKSLGWFESVTGINLLLGSRRKGRERKK